MGLLFPINSKGFFYMHPKDRITHTTVMEHWLEQEIAQWVHHEGSIRWPIAPWANALTTELHLAPTSTREGSRDVIIFTWQNHTAIKKHISEMSVAHLQESIPNQMNTGMWEGLEQIRLLQLESRGCSKQHYGVWGRKIVVCNPWNCQKLMLTNLNWL